MQRRELGPLALTGGLYLDRARAPGNTLSDVLNMEAESGEVRTRGGCRFRSSLEPTFAQVLAYETTNAVETTVGSYIEFDVKNSSDDIEAGDYVHISLNGTNTEDIFGDRWWVKDGSDVWHEVHMLNNYVDYTMPVTNRLVFRTPIKPKRTGTVIYMRVLPANTPDGTYNPKICTQTNALWNGYGPIGGMASFVCRSGPKTALLSQVAATGYLFDIGASAGAIISSKSFATPDSVDYGEELDASMLYIPATDELLIRMGETYYVHSCSQWLDGSVSQWQPDAEADLVDTAYEDIPLRTALRRHRDMVLFEGSVFMLGSDDDPATVVWSAPAEFWKVWPEDNEYTLSSSGAGRIVGAEVINRTLYIFTDTQIWSANMAEPPAGRSEDTVVFSLVEETGCTSRDSIVAAESGIFFLSEKGVRYFDGQRSRLVTKPVEELFDRSSENPYAARWLSDAVGVWEPKRRQYRLFYKTHEEGHHSFRSSTGKNVPLQRVLNACLVIDLEDRSVWLWSGEDRKTSLDELSTGGTTKLFQSNIFMRATEAVYDMVSGIVICVTREGLVYEMDRGVDDSGWLFPWRLETQHIGLGKSRRQCLVQADVEVPKETYKSMDIAAIPDGRTDRASTRTVTPQKDGVGDVLGVADAAGEALVEASNAYGPAIARFRSQGRNHRIKVSGEGGGVRIAGITAHVIETSRR